MYTRPRPREVDAPVIVVDPGGLEAAVVREGEAVVVSEDFTPDSEGAAPLKKGMKGVLHRIDADGDALIVFFTVYATGEEVLREGRCHERPERIGKAEFAKLRTEVAPAPVVVKAGDFRDEAKQGRGLRPPGSVGNFSALDNF